MTTGRRIFGCSITVVLLVVVAVCWASRLTVVVDGALVESERLQARDERNHTWPIQKYVPDTPGWTKLLNERFAQVAEMKDSGWRYDGYRHLMPAAITNQNFTEYGFALARAPDDLLRTLQKAIRDGLPNAREETNIEVIHGERPLFISGRNLAQTVMKQMLPVVEAWSGVKLVPYTAYGFRLYRNENQLMMHADRAGTHIISFILHIDSSDDAVEPWPVFIEDYYGRTHEVVLTPGDVLLYESSKCFHGRPKPFKGSWYTSVFVHYYPAGWNSDGVDRELEAHYAVPPHWKDDPPTDRESSQNEPLEMSGMSFLEPNCEYSWCRVKGAIQWIGPGEEGYIIHPNKEKVPIHGQSEEGEEDGDDEEDMDDESGDDDFDDEEEYEEEEEEEEYSDDDDDEFDDDDDEEEDEEDGDHDDAYFDAKEYGYTVMDDEVHNDDDGVNDEINDEL